jgi:hypothetical protein
MGMNRRREKEEQKYCCDYVLWHSTTAVMVELVIVYRISCFLVLSNTKHRLGTMEE